jgi:peptidoglycan-associated lipoprotein
MVPYASPIGGPTWLASVENELVSIFQKEENMKIAKMAGAVLLALVLGACASKVRLDDGQISDAKGAQVNSTAANENANKPSDKLDVKQVTVSDANTSAEAPKDVALLVYFDFDSYVIKPEFQGVIASHARYLGKNKSAKLSIEGHTDERGGREYNLALGQRRAEAVRKSLTLLGVPDAQMEAVSFGKEKPADTGGSEEGMAKNRRAFFNYR